MKIGKSNQMWLVALFAVTIINLNPCWGIDPIDISEAFLKIQEPVILYDLGEKGFAAYDVGDSKMKFFDWNLKQVKQFPLKKGEGPGEIKNLIVSTCIVNGKIYLAVLFDKNLKVFQQNGKYEKDIPLDFMPRDMFFKNGSLYFTNLSINATAESFSLGTIADPVTGKKTKDIIMHERLFTPKNDNMNPMMIGMASTLDVGNDGSVYLLYSSENILVALDVNNQVKYRGELPYKERKTMQKVTENGEESVVLTVLDWYTDMRALDDGVYTCFEKTVKDGSETGKKEHKTVVIKVIDKNEMIENEFEGKCIIIGRHKGRLYLFNTGEYTVIPAALSLWQKKM